MATDIAELLDDLALRLRAGVSLDDTTGRLLGHSVQSEDADEARVSAILTRRVPARARAWQEQHGVGEASGPVRVPADPEHTMAARLCVPVRHEERTVALLWILEPGRPLDPGEVEQAVRVAALLAEPLVRPAAHRLVRRTVGEAWRDLLRGDTSATGELPSGPATVTVVVPSPGTWAPAAVTSLERTLAGWLRSGRSGIAAGAVLDLAAVLLRPVSPSPAADVRARVAETVPDVAVATGTATGATVAEALDRARRTARWAALDPALPRDSTWADAGLHRWAEALPADAVDLLGPLVDHGSGSMLLSTVETYLDLGADAQRTAAALHLHRTTLYYRLGRAQDLLGLDLADGLVRTRVHLALKRRRLG